MDVEEIDTDKSGNRSGIQVIARAAAILRTLKDAPSGMSLGQIADRAELPRSTVQRIVQALQEERMVITSGSAGGVRLGPELHALAGAAHYNIVDQLRPLLQDLMEETGETVDLSVLRGGRMIFLDQVQGTHRLRAVSSAGEVFPVTSTANGRACLALMSESEARKMAENEWERLGQPSDWPALSKVLTKARSHGLAEDHDDHTAGISALGFAFVDSVGDLHAVSVPVPSPRYIDQKPVVTAALLRLRSELPRLLGL
ncbi:MAG: IclR family transcriptional regulator [Rhodobacter sp.]|nr:IclR family transcriptional regulator [Rhodobacter sp.]MCA3520448.1 IclR family transcriptional regulator [Rhodobacter sp.]MCA3526056.1 IclR family transcriptional regulator [Rhodobacter sp.]MCA3532970.1 IclR family transcriptional regulator [Rhodobacter sp.]MCA3534888.1 IclR family transcriptional regulator [Rhodobacter sp.]